MTLSANENICIGLWRIKTALQLILISTEKSNMTSSEAAKVKEKGASEYQKQKQVVSDLLTSAESTWLCHLCIHCVCRLRAF